MQFLGFWLRRYGLELLFILPAFFYLAGFLIVILYYLFSLSLSASAWSAGWENYHTVIFSADFLIALKNTIFFVVIGTPLELVVGMVLALLLYRSFAGRGIIRSIFIIPLAIPTIVTATILFVLFVFPSGHINNLLTGKHAFFPALVQEPINWRNSAFFAMGISMLGKVWRDMPISMLILLAGLNAIDHEQYDAAETMGAGSLIKFRMVTLPSILPAVGTVLLMRSIEMWKEFVFPFILAPSFPLLGTYLESLYRWGHPEQAAVVALVILFCIAVSTVVIHGLTRGIRNFLVKI